MQAGQVRQSGDSRPLAAPPLWRCGRECTENAERAGPEFSWATGGAVVFVYAEEKKGWKRKWELLSPRGHGLASE